MSLFYCDQIFIIVTSGVHLKWTAKQYVPTKIYTYMYIELTPFEATVNQYSYPFFQTTHI